MKYKRHQSFLRKTVLSLLLFAVFLLMPNVAMAVITQTYNSPGTYIFTVPHNNQYTITAHGASGGTAISTEGGSNAPGGSGAYATGTFNLTAGTNITIMVGGQGSNSTYYGGGGGGSFVAQGNRALVVAGGGGGGGFYIMKCSGCVMGNCMWHHPWYPGYDAWDAWPGQDGRADHSGDSAGDGFAGWSSPPSPGAGGGGSFSHDSNRCVYDGIFGGIGNRGGKAFLNGGAGGTTGGGFGGGGGGSHTIQGNHWITVGAGGGGGGYSGGHSGFPPGGQNGGRGGGSFVAASAISSNTSANANNGNGSVTIQYPDKTPPSQSASVSVSPTTTSGGNTVNVSWTGVTNWGTGTTRNYRIQFYNGSNWTGITTVNSTTTSYTFTTPEQHIPSAMVRVRAETNHGNSSYRNSNTFAINYIAPTVPRNLNMNADPFTDGDVVTINWSPPSNWGTGPNQAYRVEFFNGNSWTTLTNSTTNTNHSYSVPNNINTTSARFRITSHTNHGSSSALSSTFIIDNTPPTGSVVIKNGDTYTNTRNIVLTLNATDNLSGINQVRIRNGTSGSWSTNTHTVTRSWTLSEGEGTKTVQVQFNDNVGQWSIVYSDTIIFDETPPEITLSTYGEETWETEHPVTISIEESISGIAYSRYGWSTNPATPPGSWSNFSSGDTITTPSNASGDYYLHVTVRDGATNTTDVVTNRFRIDNTNPSPPDINFLSPSDYVADEWINENVTFEVVGGTDSYSGIKQREYRINKGEWQIYENPITLENTGIYNVDARTVDDVNNTSVIVSTLIKVDHSVPEISFVPQERVWLSHQAINVNVTIEPGISGLEIANYIWTTSAAEPTSGWSDHFSASLTTGRTAQLEKWYLHVKAENEAGNTNYVYGGKYRINTHPPIPGAFLLPEEGGTLYGGDTVALKWNPSVDPDGDNVLYELEFDERGEGNWNVLNTNISTNEYIWQIPVFDSSGELLDTDSAVLRVRAKDICPLTGNILEISDWKYVNFKIEALNVLGVRTNLLPIHPNIDKPEDFLRPFTIYPEFPAGFPPELLFNQSTLINPMPLMQGGTAILEVNTAGYPDRAILHYTKDGLPESAELNKYGSNLFGINIPSGTRGTEYSISMIVLEKEMNGDSVVRDIDTVVYPFLIIVDFEDNDYYDSILNHRRLRIIR